MGSRLTKLVVGLCTGLVLSACGVKSSPQQPEGSAFPAQYPAASPTVVPTAQPSQPTSKALPPVTDPKSFWQYPNTPPAQ